MELKYFFMQDSAGNVIPEAVCYLYLPDTNSLVTGLLDVNNNPLSNPFYADDTGFVQFRAPTGVYDLAAKRLGESGDGKRFRLQFADLTESLAQVAADKLVAQQAASNASTSASNAAQTKTQIDAIKLIIDQQAVAVNDNAQSVALQKASVDATKSSVDATKTQIDESLVTANQNIATTQTQLTTATQILASSSQLFPSKIGKANSAIFLGDDGVTSEYRTVSAIGDILITARNPGKYWMPANGTVRSISTAPIFSDLLGRVGGAIGEQFVSTTPASNIVDIGTAPSPIAGGTPRVMLAINSSTLNFIIIDPSTNRTVDVRSSGSDIPNSITHDDLNNKWISTIASSATCLVRSSLVTSGTSWVTVNLPAACSKVVADESGVWIAIPVASSTSVFRSIDQGANWTTITTGTAVVHTGAASDNTGTWVVSTNAGVRRSVDGGVSFTAMTLSGSYSNVSTNKKGTWVGSIVTSTAAGIVRSFNNGLTWTTISTATAALFYDVAYTQDVFIGVRSISPQLTFFSSLPDALEMTTNTSGVLASAAKVAARDGYVFAVSGTTLLTSAPKFQYDTNSQFQLPSVSAPPGLKAWVKVGNSMITSGKGIGSTIDVNVPDSSGALYSAIATNGNGILMGFKQFYTVVSLDGGATFNAYSNPITSAANAITADSFGSNSQVWMVGGGTSVYRSTNNGQTFASVNVGQTLTDIKKIICTPLGHTVIVQNTGPAFIQRSGFGGTTFFNLGIGTTVNCVTNPNGTALLALSSIGLYISANAEFSIFNSILPPTTFTVAQMPNMSLALFDNGTIAIYDNLTSTMYIMEYGSSTWNSYPSITGITSLVPLGGGNCVAVRANGTSTSSDFGKTFVNSTAFSLKGVAVKQSPTLSYYMNGNTKSIYTSPLDTMG